MARFQHVIWDWNGTLVDDVAAAVETINRLLAARALPPLDTQRYQDVFGFPVRRYYEQIGFDFGRESFERTCDEFIEHYNARWKRCSLRPFARDVLAQLCAHRVSHSVLSATQRVALRAQAEHHALHRTIDCWIGLDDFRAHSKLEEGRRWLASQPLAAEQILLVGDTLHDFEVAEQLGVACLLVEGGHNSAARLRQSGATVCRDLREVLAVVAAS